MYQGIASNASSWEVSIVTISPGLTCMLCPSSSMICWPGPGMMKWRIPKVCLEDIRGFKVVFEFQVTVWTAFCTATKYNSTRNLLQHCWDVHYEDPLRCGFSVNSINWSMVSALSALSNFTNRLHDLHTVRWSLVLERVLTWKHKLCTIVDHTLWKAM